MPIRGARSRFLPKDYRDILVPQRSRDPGRVSRRPHERVGHLLGNADGGYSTLDDVDVHTTAVSDGQVLQYDATKKLWVPTTIATSSAGKYGVQPRSNSWIASARLSTSSLAVAAGAVIVAPLFISGTVAIDQWLCNVITAAASSNAVGVVYAAGTDGYPTTLQANLGTVATTTTGIKNTAVSPAATLTAGLYWIGVFVYGGTPALSKVAYPASGFPWNTLGNSTTYGQADYRTDGVALGGTSFFAIEAYGLGDFDNGGRTTPPATFGAYTGCVNSPATTDNGTVNSPTMIGLHVQ